MANSSILMYSLRSEICRCLVQPLRTSRKDIREEGIPSDTRTFLLLTEELSLRSSRRRPTATTVGKWAIGKAILVVPQLKEREYPTRRREGHR